MDDPKTLREVARKWRQMARFHDPSAAIALTDGARELERKAERLERGAPVRDFVRQPA
jgi:hypothetical protein